LTFGRLPELDRIGRPKMFYGTRLHDQCYRRAFFDNGQFVESWDDEGAKKGWCLYKMGCRGPTTYNSCATVKWNNGVSWPIGSGHGCIGCSEENFWDDGPLYERLAKVAVPGIQATPETIGKVAAGLAVAGVAAHLGTLLIKRSREQKSASPEAGGSEDGGSRS
jgi:hydrogenase small subunit